MRRLVVAQDRALEPQLAPAVDLIRRHGVVGFPTDTLYGLAADPRSADALARVIDLKGRSAGKSIALIAASLDQAFECAVIEGDARRLAEAFWPGPLTLVVPSRGGLLDPVLSAGGLVGVRVPLHPVACALARLCGFPITATSANPSGRPATSDPDEIARALPELQMLVDGGVTAGGPPSTLVQVTASGVLVLRDGAIPAARVLESLVRTE